MPPKTLHAVVRGRVTGVGYRAFCADEASAMGLSGWARNLPDDSVELWAQGPPDRLAVFVEACRRGPRLAHVNELHHCFEDSPGDPFNGFSIRHDGSQEEAQALRERFVPGKGTPEKTLGPE